MGFTWTWRTKAGIDRQENQDFAGIAELGNSLLAIISDGVSSRSNSAQLTRALTQHLVDELIANHDRPPTIEDVACYLKNAFTSLKQSCSPNASAAFLVAYFYEDRLMYVLHAGDCRIGVRSNEKKIDWKTEVHSLANAIAPLTEESLRAHPARNQLTRSFSLKRLKAPEVSRLACEYLDGAILATDGFWAGLPLQNQSAAFSEDWQDPSDNQDDISHLIIRWGSSPTPKFEEGSGIYVKRRGF